MTQHCEDAEAIFLAALDKTTVGERLAYVEQACRGSPQLLERLRELLKAHQDPRGPLDAPPPGVMGTMDQPGMAERPGTVIGPYKLLEQIGEGGFGVVFVAEQQEPIRRKVALKVLKPGMDTRQVIARFEAERQALALMDHPNIAHVLDAGATSTGRPYAVMELVKGVPITDFCNQESLAPRQRLELFVHVCQAVQHAHQKGIIHRDLKPTNVLVTLHDGTPVVKVIDFGIAKALGQQLTDKTLYTGFAQLLGTPLYMSPEQAALSGLDVDTRSDIYSLGVLLYELLTGTTPFDQERLRAAGYEEMRRIIREEEPPRPSTRLSTLGHAATLVSGQRRSDPKRLSQLCRGELDWIVMKALEKDRGRRYESASALAQDIERYLHDEPVQACPPSRWYRLRKVLRKHRGAAVTAAAFLVLLLAGVAVSTWLAVRATAAESDALEGWADADREGKAAREARTHAEQAEVEAKREAAKAVANLDEAVKQRRRAEVSEASARAVVDEYLVEVTESELLRVPGLQPLRRDLLIKGLKFYRDYLKEHGNDPTLRADLAAAHLRVGKVYRELASWSEAHKALGEARALYETLVSTHPEERYLDHLADCYLARGEFANAVATWEKLVSANPLSARLKRNLGQAYNEQAVGYFNSGKFSEALATHYAALTIREGLVKNEPDNPEDQSNLGATLNNIGVLLSQKEHHKEALLMYRRAAAHQAVAFSRSPQTTLYGRFLAINYTNVAHTEFRLGLKDQALRALEKSHEVCTKLARDNPAVPYLQATLWKAHWTMANWQRDLGHTAEAGRAARLAAEVIERLPKQTAEDLFYMACARARCSGLIVEAKQKLTSDEQVESRHQADQAIEALRGAIAAGYNDAAQMKTSEDLASLRQRHEFQALLADLVARTATQPAEKLKASQEALAWRQKLAASDRDNGRLQIDLAASYRAVGLLQFQLGHEAAAAQSLGRAVAILETLKRRDPEDTAYQTELALAYKVQAPVLARQAWLLATSSDLKLRKPRRAVELAQRAVEIAPEEGTYWSTLGTAHYRLGDWKAAIAALEKSVDRGGFSSDFFVVAMAYWQLCEKTAAHQWYIWAVQSIREDQPRLQKDEPRWKEFCAFRGEAAELLQIKSPGAAPEKAGPQLADASQIEQLIKQLGSNAFTKRQEASKRLEEIGEPAWNAVRHAAASHNDPEIRRRAKRAADAIASHYFVQVYRLRHDDSVNSVAFSPDGQLLASAGRDHTVRLSETATGKLVRILRTPPRHQNGAFTVVFSPDGKTLACAISGGLVTLWETATGRELRSLSIKADEQGAGLAFSPDGQMLATGGSGLDPTIKLWKTTTGTQVRAFKGHKDQVYSLAFSRDGQLLASASWDSTVKLWEPATGKEVRTLTGHTGWADSVAFTSDGKLVACAGRTDASTRIWQTATGKQLVTLKEAEGLPAQSGTFNAVAFLGQGRLLAAGTSEGTVQIWDTNTRERLIILSGHTMPVIFVASSPDGQLLAAAGDYTASVWRRSSANSGSSSKR
jgi:serine/threonine protein kinase/tetratricopeptide (TPR) repeat protein